MTGPADPALSAWVSANAGAGKTRVLVERVMRLLLETDSPPERILCLTFTKAAATEMATRLASRLGAWALMDDAKLAASIRQIGAPSPDAARLAKARVQFARALETPGGLKIQTIHAFCERLLSRFPLEAGLPAHFTVADDRTAGELLRAAQNNVLTAIAEGQDAEAAEALDVLARVRDEAGFEDLLQNALSNRTAIASFLETHVSLDARRTALARAVGLESFMREADAKCEVAREVDEISLRRAAAVLLTGLKSDIEKGNRIASYLRGNESTRVKTFEDYKGAFLTQKDEPQTRLITSDLRRANPDVAEILAHEQRRLLAVVERLRAARAAELTDAALTLLRRVLRRYDAAKSRRAMLDYHDLIAKTAFLLGRTAAAAWVLFKLDGGLDHILIDEAQDTSPEQWTVIERLAEEFFAGEGTRTQVRTVFVVGDEKQSIYSFQGADPGAFEAMREKFRSRLENDSTRWREFDLVKSYRSVAPILELVDRVFAFEDRAQALGVGARGVKHLLHRSGHGGRVEIWPAEMPDEAPRPDPWTLPVDHIGTSSPAARLARRVADAIEHLVSGHEILASEGRPVRAGDILVLVQRRGPFVEELIRRLKQKNIPVAGADRLDILSHIAVMDLMALGAFALLPEDDLNLAALLRSPLAGLSEEQLLTLTQMPGRTLWAKLRDASAETFAAARMRLEEVLGRADFVSPYDFFAHHLTADLGRQKLLRRLGPDANDPIDEFLRLALEYERLHPPSLQGFLAWLAGGPSEIKRDLDHGRDEVRVMTVHGAKGLEAPIVILPDTCTTPYERMRPGFREVRTTGETRVPMWSRGATHDPQPLRLAQQATVQAGAAEHLRLLYVALTRARDRLILCGHEGRRGRPAMSWYTLADAAMSSLVSAPEASSDIRRVEVPQTVALDGVALDATARVRAESLPSSLLVRPRDEPMHGPVLSPSALVGPGAPEMPVRGPGSAIAADRTRYLRGRLIHRLLERLPEVAPSEREARARQVLAHGQHDLTEPERDDIVRAALGVLEAPVFAEVFSTASRAEVPVIGEILLRGRRERIYGVVDRLAVTPRRILIVDFKTNRPPAKSIDDVPALYLRQMAAYRAVLRDVYPGREVDTALVWTEGPALMPLPPEALDAALAQAGLP